MDCTEIRPLISYYYDGEATPEERAKVEKHLAGCEDCRQVLAEYRAISGDIRDMAVPAPPVGLRRDVWRAIEAQQAGMGARVFGASAAGASARKRNQEKVVQFPQKNKTGLAGVFASVESGWSRALTAALVIGALFIALGVLIVLQRGNTLEAASLIDQPPYSDYYQVVHIQFNKSVAGDDVAPNTKVVRVDTKPESEVPVTMTFTATTAGGVLSIEPQPAWVAGAKYEVRIDSPKIHRSGVAQPFEDTPHQPIAFETMAYTPTPTSSPTNTPIPTDTPVPTKQPTTVAEDTAVSTPVVPVVEPSSTAVIVVASATPEPSKPADTSTPRPNPTSTHGPPTNTPVPPVPPSATATHAPEPTSTPVETATTVPPTATATPHPNTPTPTPIRGTPTPKPPCTTMPVNGFGKVWSEHPEVRNRIGCPTEYETAIQAAADERFQGGYMFWRGDTKKIYVFLWGSPQDLVGTWLEFPDTWNDGDPEPTPAQPAPSGFYTPVRGFGKIWRENENLRLSLGYAIEPEQAVTGAWQAYEHGYALWTDDKIIRFMFNDSGNIWMRFEDTFVMPTATATR